MDTVSDKNKSDLENSFELLAFYIKHYEEGRTNLYLPMAVELRKLLCEKDPAPLITRVIPNFNLYKLNTTKIFEQTPSLLVGLENIMPGRLENLENGITNFSLGFAKEKELMSIDNWVDQYFFNENITIRELIKSVADKEATHSDKNYNNTLLHCKNWSFNDTNCHILGIYAISKYLYSTFISEYSQ